jgi:hypothetical protein
MGLFDRAEPLAQSRDGLVPERNDLRHSFDLPESG